MGWLAGRLTSTSLALSRFDGHRQVRHPPPAKSPESPHLVLSSTKIDSASVVCLQGLTNLRTLNLNDTAIADDALASLELRGSPSLALRNTHVRDAGLCHLSELGCIGKLNLGALRLVTVEPPNAVPNADVELLVTFQYVIY